jgi:hypothetical protein
VAVTLDFMRLQGITAAASVAVVFASNDESEGSDLSSIDLSSVQNSLIAAVAAANPHTVVVLNTGSAVTMPWLSSVGDSDANLPLTGTLSVAASQLGGPVTITSGGTITGTPSTAGTSTVTVTAKDGTGAAASTSFTWTVAPAGSGLLTAPLVGYQGLCLDLTCDGNTDGTKVEIYTCNGTGAQVWQPQAGGAIVNPQSGKCLDDTGWSTTPGTQVLIWACTGGANQAWSQP